MADITVVIGPPCAGKSTYVADHAAAGDVVVDYDKIAGALGSPTPHAAPPGVREVAFAARAAAIDEVKGGIGAPAWIIHTSPRPGQLAAYRTAGADLVLLDPGMDECLARADSDSRPAGTAEAIRGWYESPPVLGDPQKGMRGMRIKSVAARVKATGDDTGAADTGLQPGQFTALVSVFGNEDSMGDVVVPGAFTKTLADWQATGDPIPVIWSHDWSDPFAHVGITLNAEESPEGLLVTGQIEDLDTNPTAAQVYRLLKGRRVTQFSFAYDVIEEAWVQSADDPYGYYELRQLKLYEVGPCLVGANQETELIAAKAATLVRGAKAGRVLSQQNFEALTAAHVAIGQVLDAASPEKTGAAAGKTEETPGQPGPESTGASPAEAPAQTPATEPAKGETNTTASSTEDETTPDPRETPDPGVAKAAAASARLRHTLRLDELELTLTE